MPAPIAPSPAKPTRSIVRNMRRTLANDCSASGRAAAPLRRQTRRMLQLDHVFCFVPPDGDWAGRLTVAGWALDAGTVHEGQGSRNRRLAFAGQFLELVWLHDPELARANPLRLDRRAHGAGSGASPFGFGLR